MNELPIFHAIFGELWDDLPQVMHKHYVNRAFSDDVTTVEGIMNITMSPITRLLAPFLSLTKTLVPKAGQNIAVTVSFRSELHSNHFIFDREFRFDDGKIHRFISHMEPIGNAEVIEWTASGMGWRAEYSYEDGKVILKHRGYCIKIFGKRLSLPIEWLFGRGEAYETPTSDNSFDMTMSINHQLLGKLYGYDGSFSFVEK